MEIKSRSKAKSAEEIKTYALIVFAIAVLALAALPWMMTGRFVLVSMNVNTTSKPGAFILLDYPYTVTQYSSMNITALLKNSGGSGSLIKMETYILDVNFTVKEVFYDGYYNIIPGDERPFLSVYTPVNTGFYVIRTNTTFANRFVEAWGVFEVLPYYTPPAEEEEVTGGGVTPAREEIGSPRMDVEYTNAIEIRKGQSFISYIKVKNTGTGNKSLYDVTFFAKSMGLPFTVTPQQIARIGTGEYGIFLLTINAPLTVDSGEYSLDFNVTERRLYKTGSIKVTVVETDIMSDIYSTMMNYLYILQRLEIDAQTAFEGGKNVTSIQGYIVAADSLLREARRLYDSGDYYLAREKLKAVKTYLELIVSGLASISAPALMVLLPGFVSLLIILIVILASIPLLIIFYTRRRSKEREESAKKTEEGA
jgi:hypothetical protein